MPKYRKKPVVIEAFQFTEDASHDRDNWPEWLKMAWFDYGYGAPGGLWLMGSTWYCGTLEGQNKITLGDFIIQGVDGEIYPCKPDIFHRTYEAVGG